MSRERELLQKVVNHMWQGELVDEIKELLAQPEQDNFDKLMQNCNVRKEAIAELILCMRFSNKHDLAQAVLDYIQGLSSANREKRND
jgi:hypothetical protein